MIVDIRVLPRGKESQRPQAQKEDQDRHLPPSAAAAFERLAAPRVFPGVEEKVVEGIRVVLDAGYKGVWGVESMPQDGDEIKARRDPLDKNPAAVWPPLPTPGIAL